MDVTALVTAMDVDGTSLIDACNVIVQLCQHADASVAVAVRECVGVTGGGALALLSTLTAHIDDGASLPGIATALAALCCGDDGVGQCDAAIAVVMEHAGVATLSSLLRCGPVRTRTDAAAAVLLLCRRIAYNSDRAGSLACLVEAVADVVNRHAASATVASVGSRLMAVLTFAVHGVVPLTCAFTVARTLEQHGAVAATVVSALACLSQLAVPDEYDRPLLVHVPAAVAAVVCHMDNDDVVGAGLTFLRNLGPADDAPGVLIAHAS